MTPIKFINEMLICKTFVIKLILKIIIKKLNTQSLDFFWFQKHRGDTWNELLDMTFEFLESTKVADVLLIKKKVADVQKNSFSLFFFFSLV